jgi:hypothetical protein
MAGACQARFARAGVGWRGGSAGGEPLIQILVYRGFEFGAISGNERNVAKWDWVGMGG